MARNVYLVSLVMIAAAVLGAAGWDFLLWLMGRPTISAYLRENPNCFLWPMLLTLIFLGLLTFHLFAAPWSK